MRRAFGCAILSLVVASMCLAQVPAPKAAPAAKANTVKQNGKAKTEKPAQQEPSVGLKMLEIAEADSGPLEPGMRAYVQLEVSRGFQATDRGKSLELLESAFVASGAIPEDDFSTRDRLRERILRNMVSLAPARADELLPQLAAERRGPVLDALLTFYEQNDNFDHALEMLQRMSQDSEVSYSTAERLMAGVKVEQSAEFQRIFLIALNSYRDHEHKELAGSGQYGDFAKLVIRYWERLPKEIVRQSIDELLKQAKESDKAESGNQRVASIATPKGNVSFGSAYEYRLFQLVPILREIDESSAESMMRDYQMVSALLNKYPDGTKSLYTADEEDASHQAVAAPGRVSGTASGTASNGGVGLGGRGTWSLSVQATPDTLAAKMAEMHRAQSFVADAEKHPDDAMANMETVSDLNLRLGGYEGIARMTWKQHPSIAHSALNKVLDNVDKTQGLTQEFVRLQSVCELYLQMKEPDNARAVIEKGFAFAAKAYKRDTNADDPNKGFKAYWPSTEAYRVFAQLAAKVSPSWAMEMAKEIRDDDMKAIAESALALALLDVPKGPSMIVDAHKSSSYTMLMD